MNQRRQLSALELVGAAAAAGLFGRGDVDVKSAVLEAVDEVHRGVVEVQFALLVDHEIDAEVVVLRVLHLVEILVERERWSVTAATASNDLHAEKRLAFSLHVFFVL